MRYCPDCGTGHECEAATEGRTDPSVEIARINADRDIAVAKLAARSGTRGTGDRRGGRRDPGRRRGRVSRR